MGGNTLIHAITLNEIHDWKTKKQIIFNNSTL